MDRRERSGDIEEGLRAALEGWQTGIYTSMPGILQTYDADKQTCSVQPALQAQVQNPDGSYIWVTLPLLVDCPVQFARGGGVSLTFPMTQGDEGLICFSSRCIDSWWQSGGIQVQAEIRLHDLSDGIFIPGITSQPRKLSAVSTTTAQLRSDDGATMVELDPVAHKVNLIATADINLTAGGNINITGVLVINGQPFMDHTHSPISGVGGTKTGKVT